jgi:hypothetical protein
MQVHNKAVRDINFTHNGNFVLACDDSGSVKISSINLKPLQDIDAHNLVSAEATMCWGHVRTACVPLFNQAGAGSLLGHMHSACAGFDNYRGAGELTNESAGMLC